MKAESINESDAPSMDRDRHEKIRVGVRANGLAGDRILITLPLQTADREVIQ